jgi:tetratricopeptide (TPR) repeat protein
MKAMKETYLLLIEAEIARAPDRVSADCLRAKLAAYLVRQGRLVEANLLIDDLRARYAAHPVAAISSWLNLVEGLRLVFNGRNADAIDRMLRAHALASAAGLLPMRALCAGWLANLKFGALDVEAVAERLLEALQFSADADHQALSRACLVAAVALHFANRYDLARPWYQSSQIHAVKEGDEATLSALMHNKACMGVATLRQAVLEGAAVGTPLTPDALLQADSTINYDSLVGTQSVSAWAPILKAQALSLRGMFAASLEIYDANLESGKSQGLSRVLCYMYADIAHCQLRLGRAGESRSNVDLAIANLSTDCLIDDRAATHSRLAETLRALGAYEEAAIHADAASEAWRKFRQLQERIVARFSSLVPR